MGRASRHVSSSTRSMDDRSPNGTPALAALQPLRRGQTLPHGRQGQGQCERQARRRLADLSMHGLRRHLEPPDPGASAAADDRPRVPGRARGQRPGADASPGARRRESQAAGRARRAVRRCRGDPDQAVGERSGAAPAKNPLLCSRADRASPGSAPRQRAAAVAKRRPAAGEERRPRRVAAGIAAAPSGARRDGGGHRSVVAGRRRDFSDRPGFFRRAGVGKGRAKSLAGQGLEFSDRNFQTPGRRENPRGLRRGTYAAAGRSTRKRLPPPSAARHTASPPCRRAMSRTRARPKPLPRPVSAPPARR